MSPVSAGLVLFLHALQLLRKEPVEKPVCARAVTADLQPPQGAGERAEIEALVLLVAAAERGGGEVPGQPEDPAALPGIGADALQVFLQQRPQRFILERRPRRRGQQIVRTELAD